MLSHQSIDVEIGEPYCVLSNPVTQPRLQIKNRSFTILGTLGRGWVATAGTRALVWPGRKCDKESTEARTRAMLVDSLHWRVLLAFQNNTFPAPALALALAVKLCVDTVHAYCHIARTAAVSVQHLYYLVRVS